MAVTPFIIPTVYTAVDKMSGPVMRMQAAVMGLANIGGARGTELQKSLEKTGDAASKIATSMLPIGLAIGIPFAIAGKQAMDFEKQMANVSTLVDTTKESMDAMGDSVLNLAKRTPVKLADLTESLYQIRSAGVDAAHAMGVLDASAKLSVAGLSTST